MPLSAFNLHPSTIACIVYFTPRRQHQILNSTIIYRKWDMIIIKIAIFTLFAPAKRSNYCDRIWEKGPLGALFFLYQMKSKHAIRTISFSSNLFLM